MKNDLSPQQQRELLELRITLLRLEIAAERLRHRQQQATQQQQEQSWLAAFQLLETLPSRHFMRHAARLPFAAKHRVGLGIVWWLWQQWRKWRALS